VSLCLKQISGVDLLFGSSIDEFLVFNGTGGFAAGFGDRSDMTLQTQPADYDAFGLI